MRSSTPLPCYTLEDEYSPPSYPPEDKYLLATPHFRQFQQ
jgi:hypothetical protein